MFRIQQRQFELVKLEASGGQSTKDPELVKERDQKGREVEDYDTK